MVTEEPLTKNGASSRENLDWWTTLILSVLERLDVQATAVGQANAFRVQLQEVSDYVDLIELTGDDYTHAHDVDCRVEQIYQKASTLLDAVEDAVPANVTRWSPISEFIKTTTALLKER